MNDIPQSSNVALINARNEGRGQGKGGEGGPPPKKVANAYQEIAKAKPVDDRITILGIPAEQITPATQAALASLVAEINFLRSAVKRLDGKSAYNKNETKTAEVEVLPAAELMAQLSHALAPSPEPGVARVLVLAYLSTFEDVRRSSGILAANSLLADLAQRLSRAEFLPAPEPLPDGRTPATRDPGRFRLRLVGFAGGSTLAGLAELPQGSIDETFISRQVRDHCIESGFSVGGIDMAVALAVAAVVISANEGALTAIARADHLLRGSNI